MIVPTETANEDASAKKREDVTDAPRNGPVLLYAARAEALGGDGSAAAELAASALNATDPALPAHQCEAALKIVG
jgi:hypothetical protein